MRFFLPSLLLTAVTAIPALAADEAKPLLVGEPLPSMRGELLTGKTAVLPDSAHGRCTLLILGFTVDARVFVEAWSSRFRRAWKQDPSVTFFEIPVLGGAAARLARPLIDSRIRTGTPKQLHGNVMTVWGALDEWKKRIEFRAPEDAYVVLLDRDGRVAWRHAGPCEDGAWDALDRVMQQVHKH